ncbi:hypothetical protein [Sphingobacterium tabacisoli]|uniref:Uncharacterized protein n=1 Tax=Sphingobacterium tabacisoli TaxID=2044855 RepID=A0ABW5L4F1_9SPHI|nr:hypothetical protein [Sphingobacterium tabacisoli]
MSFIARSYNPDYWIRKAWFNNIQNGRRLLLDNTILFSDTGLLFNINIVQQTAI